MYIVIQMRFQNCIDSNVLSRDSGTADGLKIWEKTKAQFSGGLKIFRHESMHTISQGLRRHRKSSEMIWN